MATWLALQREQRRGEAGQGRGRRRDFWEALAAAGEDAVAPAPAEAPALAEEGSAAKRARRVFRLGESRTLATEAQ
eukprot:15439527-Alexandrium_andersonii.AAC.1